MKQLITFLSFIFYAFSSFSQTNDQRIVALEPQLNKLLTDWKAAGFSVAVVQKNKLIYANGFGYRDYEKKLPATPNTLYPIGSCTKAFTSSLIGQLANDKALELDKPVHEYLPSLAFYNTGMTNNITLRDMMSHRTGLPRHDISWYLFPTTSRDSFLQRIRYMEPTAELRQRWQYNNFMFFLQGVVAEKLTNQSWENNIKKRFFSPLGMNRSNFSVLDLAKDNDASIGYYTKNDSIIKKLPYYNIDAMGPAGSINSSVVEMSNWVTAWINNGKFNGKTILPESYRQEAISSQMVMAPALPSKETPDVFFSNYGFGWFLSSYRGHYRVEHGGNIDGFSANTAFFPTDSIGIIVLTNQNGSSVPSIVRNLIADKLLNLSVIDWSSNLKKQQEKTKAAAAEVKKSSQSNRKTGTRPSHPLKDYAGVYQSPGYGSLEIISKGDSLIAFVPNKKLWLQHYHYDIFQPLEIDPVEGIDTSDAPDFKFQFITDLNGNISAFRTMFEPGLQPIEFTRKEKEVALTAEMLKKYEGEYELPGASAKVYTKGNTLFAFVPGQPEYELTSVGNDKFNFKALSGFALQFHKDDKGNVNAVSFIQPNGTFKAAKK